MADEAMDWMEDYNRVKKAAGSGGTSRVKANLHALHDALCRMEREPGAYDLRVIPGLFLVFVVRHPAPLRG